MEQVSGKIELKGIMGLLMVTVFWGIGFPAMKIASESFPTFYQIGLRFLIAAVILALMLHKKIKMIDRKLVKSGFILSVFLFCTYMFATLGIQHTSTAKASFLSCLAVVFVPFILLIFCKVRVRGKALVSVLICAAGLLVISYTGDMGFALSLGDILCLCGSVCAASHLVAAERFVKGNDPGLITLIQMGFISAFGFAAAFVLEDFPLEVAPASLYSLIFMGVFCTAIAFLLQMTCQQFIDSARVGIIFSLEPVNGALASFLILGDSLGIQSVIGGVLIFGALVYSEVEIKNLFPIKKKEKA